MNIIISKKQFNNDVEIVERKGKGHPDTLSDGLADTLSTNYANYTLKKFGAVLHHNFDKVGLLGGSSFVSFGKGYLTSPIRVLINGRVSTKFADEKITYRKLLTRWTKEFLKNNLPLIDPDGDLELHFNLSNQSSPGKIYEKEAKRGSRQRWFEPNSLEDIPELKKLVSNDTSLGVGYAPVSSLETIVLKIENLLNSERYQKRNQWIGSDIKLMGLRNKDKYYITICIPQIANYVPNFNQYKNNLLDVKKVISGIIVNNGIKNFELSINTRDNYEFVELYLTAIGSSIESGDEGLAGRGNRINKLISPTRPMSMEGSCGKNPVYHIGKIYYLAAFDLANKIYKRFNIENEVYLISQSGRDLLDPWIVVINVPLGFCFEKELKQIIKDEIKQIPEITKTILEEKITLC